MLRECGRGVKARIDGGGLAGGLGIYPPNPPFGPMVHMGTRRARPARREGGARIEKGPPLGVGVALAGGESIVKELPEKKDHGE